MTRPAAELRTTPAGSSSPTSSPNPNPAPGVTAPPLGIRSTPSQRTTPSDPDPFGNGGSSGATAPPSDPLDETGSTRSESDAGAGDRGELGNLKLGKKPLRDVFRGAILGASMAAHVRLATLAEERDAGAWLMSEEDAGAIADPLANIAKRHAGDVMLNADSADLVAAGVAAAAYLIGNTVNAVGLRFRLWRSRRAGLQTEQYPDPEGQQP